MEKARPRTRWFCGMLASEVGVEPAMVLVYLLTMVVPFMGSNVHVVNPKTSRVSGCLTLFDRRVDPARTSGFAQASRPITLFTRGLLPSTYGKSDLAGALLGPFRRALDECGLGTAFGTCGTIPGLASHMAKTDGVFFAFFDELFASYANKLLAPLHDSERQLFVGLTGMRVLF